MDKSQAWADYWKSGSLTSFGDRFARGYEGEIRSFWTRVFSEAPEGAVIVDFGAGNGALEEIAHGVSEEQGKALVVHAFDLAPQLPARFDTPASDNRWRLEWHAGARNEDTGLPDESVDRVVGNYAVEYGDDQASVNETARILKPGGKAVFLVHYVDSNIITGARVELDVLDEVLAKDGFLSKVREYINEFGNIRHAKQFEKFRKSGRGEPLRHEMNDAHEAAVKHCTTENAVKLMTDVSQWMGQLLQPPGLFEEKPELLRRWKEVKRFLEANRERLRDMQEAAVDDARKQRYLDAFSAVGMRGTASIFTVKDSDAPVAWHLELTKSD